MAFALNGCSVVGASSRSVIQATYRGRSEGKRPPAARAPKPGGTFVRHSAPLDVTTTGKPTIDEQAAMFDRWNGEYRRRHYSEVNDEIKARADRSLGYIASLRLDHPRILEIGCGTGWLTEKLCTIGRVWACDLSPVAIELAKQRQLNAEFELGNVLEMELPAGDVGIVFDTLFYVEGQARLVAALAERVDWLIMSNINAWVYRRCAEVPGPEPGQYRNWLSIRETRALLNRYFEIVRLETVYPDRGNLGVLRVAQSYKVNYLLRWLPLEKLKNALRMGAGVVLLARRR